MNNIKIRNLSFIFLSFFLTFSFFNPSFAQEKGKLIDYVGINNETYDVQPNDVISAKNVDVIKIVGNRRAGERVIININERSFEVITAENGQWGIIFSITEWEEKEYNVYIKMQEEEEEKIFTLKIDNSISESTIEELKENEDQNSSSNYTPFVIILFVIATLGVVLFFILRKKRKDEIA